MKELRRGQRARYSMWAILLYSRFTEEGAAVEPKRTIATAEQGDGQGRQEKEGENAAAAVKEWAMCEARGKLAAQRAASTSV